MRQHTVRSTLAGYLLALGATLAAALLRAAADPVLGDRYSFITFFGVVALVVWLAGWRPALFATILGYLVANAAFMSHDRPLALGAGDWLAFALYMTSCGAIVAIGEGMRSAQRRLQASLEDARALAERLRQEVAERETLIDILPVGVLRSDPESPRVTGNRAFSQMLGIPEGGRASLRGDNAGLPEGTRVLRDGRELPVDEQPMRFTGRTGGPLRDFEHDLAFPDGRRVTLLASTAPLLDGEGRVRAVLGAYADITGRKQAEEELRRSEERFRRMADTAPVMIWISGADKGFTWLNRPWLEFVGRTMGQELGNGWAEGVHPDDRERCLAAYTGAFDARRPFTMDYRLRRHDGVYRWVADQGVPLHDDGAFAGYIGSCVDIDDRKRAEEEVRAAEARLQGELLAMTRLHALAGRLAVCDDLHTGLEDVLERAIEAVGADRGNIQLYDPQRRVLELAVHRGFGPEFLDHFRTVTAADGSVCGRALASGESLVVEDVNEDAAFAEHRAVAASSGFRAVLSTILMTRTGGTLGMLSTHFEAPGRPSDRQLRLADLHARQAAGLIERLRSWDALREADRRKDEFLATMAHELRNPLAPILTSVELLRRSAGDPARAAYATSVIERQLGQLVRLTDDLLDASRITTGKLRLLRERIELEAVVSRAVEACRPLVDARQLELAVTLPDQPIVLDGDPARLSQVLSNLLNNAASYTEKGGRISVDAERRGREIAVSVRDTGVGIEASELSRIFDMFWQATPALERSHGGLGIGLALVRGLVELHGGRVEARSAGRGQGSEFVVTLPLATVEPLARLPPGADEKPSRAARSWRILVVDDNADAAESLAAMLRLMGHQVETAHDGQAAVRVADRSRPELMLLDIGMPRMNGHELARHVRKQPWGAATALVALTGWGDDRDRRRSLEAGFDHHLTKPVDAVSLGRLLAAMSEGGPTTNSELGVRSAPPEATEAGAG